MSYPSLENEGRKIWRRDSKVDGKWTVEEIHDAVKLHKPRFLVLPPDFPDGLRRRLFVTDPVIAGWSDYPKVIYRSDYSNIFYVFDYLYASRSLAQWRKILGELKKSGVAGDSEAADAISQALRSTDGLDIDRASEDDEAGAKLAVPPDWVERVERIEEHLLFDRN